MYLLLALGSVGTNIARYSAVRRKSAHKTNTIRTGCFYKFLAPSRFGKGIALGFLQELGNHVENLRIKGHEEWVIIKQRDGHDNGSYTAAKVKLECSTERPNFVFLTGANVLQTHACAASNAGCGIMAVTEIKSGKTRYTDTDGSYGTMLDFADPQVAAKSYRKAEFIPKILKCRMQMVAAGVKED